jgi:hypothetical protein
MVIPLFETIPTCATPRASCALLRAAGHRGADRASGAEQE